MKASNAISGRTANPSAPPSTARSSSSTDRFTLAGPSCDLDPRYHAYRGDLADVALANRLFAPHYAKPVSRLAQNRARLHIAPSETSETVGEIDPGTEFAVLDISGGWAWGYRLDDHLVGYLREADLG